MNNITTFDFPELIQQTSTSKITILNWNINTPTPLTEETFYPFAEICDSLRTKNVAICSLCGIKEYCLNELLNELHKIGYLSTHIKYSDSLYVATFYDPSKVRLESAYMSWFSNELDKNENNNKQDHGSLITRFSYSWGKYRRTFFHATLHFSPQIDATRACEQLCLHLRNLKNQICPYIPVVVVGMSDKMELDTTKINETPFAPFVQNGFTQTDNEKRFNSVLSLNLPELSAETNLFEYGKIVTAEQQRLESFYYPILIEF